MAYMLLIPENIFNDICIYLSELYPEEGCGILLGEISEGTYIVECAKQVKNVDGDPKNRFSMDPLSVFQIFRWAEDEGLNVIGIFHSHPEHPPYPSSHDLEEGWRGYIHLILNISQSAPGEYQAWYLSADGNIIKIRVILTEPNTRKAKG